ncbi:MAG TPA: alpha/beta hydrolase [Clostridia bacterium]|nr:alpha/beta hydrolase [Clostridia bacterium]HPK15366.1 alpha/beta hydrolase [Clostridia bacterium]
MKMDPYAVGSTAMFACQYDPRFSYCAYIPSNWTPEGEPLTMLVIVHGSGRTPQHYRDVYKEFAQEHGLIVMAPLFPCAITSFDDMSSYKYISYGGVRFDRILLAMVEEMGRRYGARTDRFLLHGFSGGGHFVHRFFYLHADRLIALSVGAPGYITLLDDAKPWHAGTANFREVFGQGIDMEALRRVPVQLVAGADDLETWEINDRDSENWMEELAEAGENRVERLTCLWKNYLSHGISAELELVPGVKHWGYSIAPQVCAFFDGVLRR